MWSSPEIQIPFSNAGGLALAKSIADDSSVEIIVRTNSWLQSASTYVVKSLQSEMWRVKTSRGSHQSIDFLFSNYSPTSGFTRVHFYWPMYLETKGSSPPWMSVGEPNMLLHEVFPAGIDTNYVVTFDSVWTPRSTPDFSTGYAGYSLYWSIQANRHPYLVTERTVADYPDADRRPDDCLARVGDNPINVINGNKFHDSLDLAVPTPSLSLDLVRMYNSRGGGVPSVWFHNHGWQLYEHNTAFQGETNTWMVLDTGSALHYFRIFANGTYGTPPGTSLALSDLYGGGHAIDLGQGRTATFSTNGTLDALHDAWGNGLTYAYTNINGNLRTRRVEHSNGLGLDYHFNGEGQLFRIESPSPDLFLTYDYDTNGLFRFSRVIPGETNSTHYLYEPAVDGNQLNLVSLTDAAGTVRSWTYATNALGQQTSLGISSRVGDADYFETYVEYPEDTNSLERTVREVQRGFTNTYTYRYHPVFRAIESVRLEPPPGTNGLSQTVETRYQFDSVGNRTNVVRTDWRVVESATTRIRYNDLYQPTNTAFGYNMAPTNAWSYTWHPDYHTLASVTDPEGRAIEFGYTNGALASVAFPLDATTRLETVYAYTTNGLLSAVTNANGHWVHYTYDAYGYPDTITPQAGPAVTLDYTLLGHLERVTFPGPTGDRAIDLDPDPLGRVRSITYPNTLTETFGYDGLGNLLAATDTAGRVTAYAYEPLGRLASVTRTLADGASNLPVTIAFDYDQQFNTLHITDPLGRRVEAYELDTLHRPVAVTNLEEQVMTVRYGLDDWVRSLIRFDDTEVIFDYDGDGRLSAAFYPDATVGFTYYRNDLLLSATNTAAALTNHYDAANRLTQTVARLSGLPVSDSLPHLSYSHLPAGQISTATLTTVHRQLSTVHQFDPASRLTNLLSVAGPFDYTYDPHNGLASDLSLPNGIDCVYGYDAMDRLTSIAYTRGPDDLLRIDYAYNEATGMITNRSILTPETRNPPSPPNTEPRTLTTSYTYDTLDRLTSETYRDAAGQIVDQSVYTYDLAGNRLTKTRNGALVEYTLGLGNRMTNWSAAYSPEAHAILPTSGHANEPIGLDPRWGERTVNQAEVFAAGANFWSPAVPVPIAQPSLAAAIGDLAGNVGFATNTILLNLTTNAAYAYDMAGNVTNISYNAGEETVGLVWNSQYELTAVHTNGALAESYRYDPLGRRVRTITGTVTNYHLYNGIHALADLDATGAVLRAYTYGPGIDNLLAMTTYSDTETNHYYYLTDHLGSVLAIADEDGEIVERYHYDAWGRVTITDAAGLPLAESALGNRFGFQGREQSWATGLTYFRSRYYDSVTGRWLSKDRIGIAGGLNQYVAFGNNPVNFLDPFGLDPSQTALFGNAINNTVTAINRSVGQLIYDVSNGQWSQGVWDDIAQQMWSTDDPENPEATPYIATGLGISGVAAAGALSVGVLEAAGVLGAATCGGLAKGEAVIGVVLNGKVIAASAPLANVSHAALAKSAGVLLSNGKLAKGAAVFTALGQSGGRVAVLGSQNFGGTANVAQSTVKAVQSFLR